MAEKQHWVPLEASSDVLNKYLKNLGVQNGEFVDVSGLTTELLLSVQDPVHAVVVRFPVTDKAKPSPTETVPTDGPGLYFIKQAIDNACGTIAIIHALANNRQKLTYEVGKPIKTFLDKTRNMSPQERAEYLANDENMRADEHDDSAQEGKTQAPAAAKKVNMYFATFVHYNWGLYELNGNFDGPVKHGDTSEDTLLQDTASVVDKFMARFPNETDFTFMPLVKKE